MKLFLDSNVFLYAMGKDHPFKEPCSTLLRAIARGEVEATTSTEVVQEVLFVIGRRGDRESAARAARGILRLFPHALPVTVSDMHLACEIFQATAGIPPRDAVHAATMLNNGLVNVVTADSDFDLISGVQRVGLLEVQVSR